MAAKPRTVKELFDFYYAFVKPLYSRVEAENVLPIETLFEINAALDHLSRHWFYGDNEEEAVEKAYSHLKRSCLDIFKLEVKGTVDRYKELQLIDTSIIDNGDLNREMVPLFNEIRAGAASARENEGDARSDDHAQMIVAFDLWTPVYTKCIQFRKRFYLHPRLDWAKRKGFWKRVKEFVWAFVIGFVSGVCSSLLVAWVWSKLH